MLINRKLAFTIISTIILISVILFSPQPVYALSINDYFTYTYNFTLSKSTIVGAENFYLNVNGSATCIKDLPLGASEAFMESNVIADVNGKQVVLNSSFTLAYSSFPKKAGETASANVQVPLVFPAGSAAGTYNVIGCLINARVKILGIWITVTGYLPSSQPIGTVSYQPYILGGGGGGVPAPNPTTVLTSFMDENGMFIEEAQVLSTDKVVKLFFPKGTMFTIPGSIGSIVSIKKIEKGSEPVHTENIRIISSAYNLEPVGATFKPPARIVISYDDDSIPQNASETDIFIAWWDDTAQSWIQLKHCTVDNFNNSVSAELEHFTIFAAFIDVSAPASFEVSQLLINPLSVIEGQPITISAEAKNVGGRTGTLNVILKINQIEESNVNITLDAGISQNISFEMTTLTPNTYYVDINGTTGVFIVKKSIITEPVLAQPEPEITTPSEQNEEPQIAPILSEPEGSHLNEIEQIQKPLESFDWTGLFASLIIGVLLGCVIIFFWYKRKKLRL